MIELVLLGVLNGMLEGFGKYVMENKIAPELAELHIEGAPGWYARDKNGHVCASAFAEGGFGALDSAREQARLKMVERIDDGVQMAVAETYQQLDDPDARQIVERFREDPGLPRFVRQTGEFTHQRYVKQERIAFTRLCLAQPPLAEYQRERLVAIASQVLDYQGDQAFEELGASTGSDQPASDNVFDELEQESQALE